MVCSAHAAFLMFSEALLKGFVACYSLEQPRSGCAVQTVDAAGASRKQRGRAFADMFSLLPLQPQASYGERLLRAAERGDGEGVLQLLRLRRKPDYTDEARLGSLLCLH